MSYILKALARSERERKRLRSPDLRDVVNAGEDPGRRPRSGLLLVMFLLANTLLLGALLFIRGPESEPVTPAVVVVETPAVPQPAPLPSSVVADEVAAAPAPTPARTEPRAVTPPATRPLLLEAQGPKPPAARTGTPAKPPVAVASAAAAPETDLSLEGVEQVDSLPGIEITVHVYADDPARRFAYVNGIRYTEGDTLRSGGARLERITRDGIVIDLGDRRALLSVRE
jgi:general secretion pathway protein B